MSLLRSSALVAFASTLLFTAAPAQALTLNDCFERVAVAVRPHHHAPAVHRVKPAVHKAAPVGKPRPRRVHRVVRPAAPTLLQTQYIMRPRACGTAEAAKPLTPVLGAFVRTPPEALLAQLAGPPPAAPEAAAPAGAPSGPVLAENAFPAAFPGGGLPSIGGGLVSGRPPTTPPDTPVVPPTPPDTPTTPVVPPTTPPDTPTTPVVPPTPPPPENPNPPPVGPFPPPPGIPPGVPEPATWAMMILGFGAIGVTLRTQRRRKLELGAAGE